MKIKVTNKKDETDVTIINLAKAESVGCKKGPTKGEKILVVNCHNNSFRFREKEYLFEEVEVTMTANVSFVKRSIPEILALYAIFD